MSARVGGVDSSSIELTDEDIAYLMNLLRNAVHPLSTQALIDALRRQTGQHRGASGPSK
jgi:hypothetical protein